MRFASTLPNGESIGILVESAPDGKLALNLATADKIVDGDLPTYFVQSVADIDALIPDNYEGLIKFARDCEKVAWDTGVARHQKSLDLWRDKCEQEQREKDKNKIGR